MFHVHVVRQREGKNTAHDLHEASELAEDGPRRHDPESDPHAPDVAAEDGDDLMSEELKEVPRAR